MELRGEMLLVGDPFAARSLSELLVRHRMGILSLNSGAVEKPKSTERAGLPRLPTTPTAVQLLKIALNFSKLSRITW